MKTTLNKIRAHSPCTSGWAQLLAHLGKTKADNEPLSIITILESNGLDDALWCLRAVEGHDREIRLLAVQFARAAQHLNPDPRVSACLDVVEKFAQGEAPAAARAAARDAAGAASAAAWAASGAASGAARPAAWAASGAAAEAAAGAAAMAAAEAAAGAAAWAAAEAAAVDAARAAARDARAAAWADQEGRLRKLCEALA